ncbi:serine hydrolase domain-containing protein [Paenibacillus marinisediminis]
MELKSSEITELMERYNTMGLSIALINDGKLSHVDSFGLLEAGTEHPVGNDTMFNACSISKLATAVLSLRLVERGILELDQDVNDRLLSWKIPASKYTQHKKVTLRTLLSHQSGVIDPERSFHEYRASHGIPSIPDLLEGRTSYCTAPIEVKYEPGSEFQYSDAGFCILEQLIEDVTGRPFKQLMDELVLEPLHMKNSTLHHALLLEGSLNTASGHHKDGRAADGGYPLYPFLAAAGLWSTAADLAKLAVELMDSLQGRSKLGLSPALIQEMTTPQGCAPWTGLGIFLDRSDQQLEFTSLGWGVGYQCMLIAYPYIGNGAVIMTNSDLGVHQNKGIIGEIVRLLDLQKH